MVLGQFLTLTGRNRSMTNNVINNNIIVSSSSNEQKVYSVDAKLNVNVEIINDKAVMPEYAHAGDACFDIRVILDKDNKPMKMEDGGDEIAFDDTKNSCLLQPGASAVFHTGLKMSTPSNWALLIYPRSSTGIKKNMMLSNTVAVIDTATYRGEILISITNNSNNLRVVSDGDRLVQGMFVPIQNVAFNRVDKLDDTIRGEGGIGSSGN